MTKARDIRALLGKAIAGADIDLATVPADRLLIEGAHHGVLGLLSSRLKAHPCPGIGEDFLAVLHDRARQLAALDLLQRHAARELLAALAGAGLDALVLKGTALACTVYDQPWHRPRTDVDVWIREAEARDVADLLAAEGYRLENVEHNVVSSRQFQASREGVPAQPVRFDLHLRISNRALFQHALDFEDSLSRAVPIPSLGSMTPDLPDRFLHCALHRVAQGRNTEGHRLIWLFDLHRLFGAMGEASRADLMARALDRRLGCLCADALTLCRELLGTDVDDAFLAGLAERRDREPSARLLTAGRWAWAWSDLRGQDSWADRGRLLRELLGNRLPG